MSYTLNLDFRSGMGINGLVITTSKMEIVGD